MYAHELFFFIHVELYIGFTNSSYKTDDFATVEFGVSDGTIGPDVLVFVELYFSDGTAISRFLHQQNILLKIRYRWQ